MVVLVAHQDAFTRSSHAMLVVVFFQTLQTRKHRWVLFRLSIFGSECVIAERVKANGLGLVRVEIQREHWAGHGQKGPYIVVALYSIMHSLEGAL